MTTVLSVLQGARDLLQDPARWCQGASAKNVSGRFVAPASPAASRWCLLGAVEASLVKQGNDGHSGSRAVALLYYEVGKRRGENAHTSVFNDTSTHADVISLLDAAIKEAEKEANGTGRK